MDGGLRVPAGSRLQHGGRARSQRATGRNAGAGSLDSVCRKDHCSRHHAAGFRPLDAGADYRIRSHAHRQHPDVLLMLLSAELPWLLTTLLVSLRLGAVMLMTPIFASLGMPLQVRVLLVLALSATLVSGMAPGLVTNAAASAD